MGAKQMRGRLIAGTAAAVLVAGCAHTPTIPSNNKGDLQHLIQYIQCEMLNARNKYLQSGDDRLGKMAAAFDLTLKSDRTIGGGLTAISSLIPISAGSIFADGKIDYSRRDMRTANIKFAISIREIPKNACEQAQKASGETWASPFGIQDWLDSVFLAFNKNEDFGSITYSIDFVIDKSAGLSPGLRVFRLEPNANASWKQEDWHTLQVTLDEDKQIGPQQVFVVNFPAERGRTPRVGRAPSVSSDRKVDVLNGKIYQSTKDRLFQNLQNMSIQNSIRAIPR